MLLGVANPHLIEVVFTVPLRPLTLRSLLDGLLRVLEPILQPTIITTLHLQLAILSGKTRWILQQSKKIPSASKMPQHLEALVAQLGRHPRL
jgi:hypothetical protein